MEATLISQEIAAYKPFQVQISDLEKENKNLVFDYESKKGNKDARSHVHKLRQSRAAVEKVRVEEKKVSLDYGRNIDAQAKEITTKFAAMIAVHATPIREVEEREEKRTYDIKARIAHMETLSTGLSNLPSTEIQTRLKEIKAITLDDSFSEFLAEAGTAKDTTLTALENAYQIALKGETEQVELVRLRKESEERQQKEREEKIRLDAETKAAADAERKASEEKAATERKARAEKEAAEKRELALKLQTEAAERRALEAEQAAAQKVKDDAAREKAAAEKREANNRHKGAVMKKALNALVEGGVSEDPSRAALKLILSGAVPNVSISF